MEQVDGVIKFNEKYWLKLHTGPNTEFRRNSKDDFQKDSFKLMNNSMFHKTMKNFENIEILSLEITMKEEPFWYLSQITIEEKCFTERLIAIDMRKRQVKMNKPLHYGFQHLA